MANGRSDIHHGTNTWRYTHTLDPQRRTFYLSDRKETGLGCYAHFSVGLGSNNSRYEHLPCKYLLRENNDDYLHVFIILRTIK